MHFVWTVLIIGLMMREQKMMNCTCELMLTYDIPACIFNVYKNQLSRQTGSRNLTGPKTLPTIWHTYMKFVTKYQISAISSCWEKYLGWMDGGKTVYPPPVEKGGYNNYVLILPFNITMYNIILQTFKIM